MNTLHYSRPSNEWLEGLPIGNGRLAAMIWGDESRDIVDLNHEWLWRGENRDRKVTPAAEHLEYVRALLKEGNYAKATLATNLFFSGNGGMLEKTVPCKVDAYQPAGTLEMLIKDVRAFEYRTLDIKSAIVTTSRKTALGQVTSEFFTDCNDGLIMSRWHSDGRFSAILSLSRVDDDKAIYEFDVSDKRLRFNCQFIGGISHSVVTEIETDGKLSIDGCAIEIKEATYILSATNIATSVFDLEAELDKYATQLQQYDCIREKHSEKFMNAMNAVSLTLNADPALDQSPTDERLGRFKEGARDNGLIVLYFNFGRYLMASSSMCADLPANIQGKWNDRIDPPWDCDYHLDINLEMNYWMAEPCNLPECAEALLKYLEQFYDSGREAAEQLYGCRGILLPIQTDVWGISTPEAFGWAAWIGAAPWLCQHFWNRYAYSGDKNYLLNRGYKFIKAVAEFYEDYLVEDEDGVLQIMPSQSPENTFDEADRLMPVGICISSAMDVQLAYDILGYAIQSAEILDIDEDKRAKWLNMRSKLPPFGIGEDGRLLEWDRELTESEPGHRHLSHLYGVFPSDLFTVEKRTAQFEAARKSLAYRLSKGGGHTGWSRAWVACLQSRFGNSEGFYEHLTALIRDFSTITLLDLHPPRIFQIDGNLGAVMAVIESIISCTDDKVYLLRSIPPAWSSGELSGIKVPGGHAISVGWENDELISLKVMIGFARSVTCVFRDGTERVFEGDLGEVIQYDKK